MWKRLSFGANKTDEEFDLENDIITEEYCSRFLIKPSSHFYVALNKWLEKCPKEWLQRFLDCDALQLMFSTLNFMGLKKASFSDAVIELEIVRSIKLILNSLTGIEYLINLHDEHCLMGSLVLGKLRNGRPEIFRKKQYKISHRKLGFP